MRRILTGTAILLLAALLLSACDRPDAKPEATAQPAAEGGEIAAVETLYAPAATAEEFRRGFLDAVNSYHMGTAGASLRQAFAATELLQFAYDYDLCHAERGALSENLQTAWTALSEEEKGYFRENFPGLGELIAQTFDDPESVAGLYGDAGVWEAAQRLLALDGIRDDWALLQSLGEELR